jgi:hypothetical protein
VYEESTDECVLLAGDCADATDSPITGEQGVSELLDAGAGVRDECGTLKRDIDLMKTRLDLPIEFDIQRNGYFYTRPVEQFPQVPMSEADVFTMFVASKAIEQYHGTPLQRMLETTFRKLTGQLDASLRFSLGNIDGVLSFRPAVMAEQAGADREAVYGVGEV